MIANLIPEPYRSQLVDASLFDDPDERRLAVNSAIHGAKRAHPELFRDERAESDHED